ncbi:uncharacterized protein ARMOST_14441 [Armillaria ostoyae]|uniref:Uncharacterized protein n=1 Tax=Armillaria ostoyae TaxID=47428 RepID=A0A284RQL5_ARMOS|nr:uncharacterized protein ARMOST_14441 [Armillaria ostoyae]
MTAPRSLYRLASYRSLTANSSQPLVHRVTYFEIHGKRKQLEHSTSDFLRQKFVLTTAVEASTVSSISFSLITAFSSLETACESVI